MSTQKSIKRLQAPQALGPYSQGMVDDSSGLIFISGQIGIDPATGELVPGGAEAEARRCLANIEAVLKAAGSGLDHAVRTVVYLADLGDFAGVNAVYSETFREPYPARSTVQVSALPKGARVEIEATAIRG